MADLHRPFHPFYLSVLAPRRGLEGCQACAVCAASDVCDPLHFASDFHYFRPPRTFPSFFLIFPPLPGNFPHAAKTDLIVSLPASSSTNGIASWAACAVCLCVAYRNTVGLLSVASVRTGWLVDHATFF